MCEGSNEVLEGMAEWAEGMLEDAFGGMGGGTDAPAQAHILHKRTHSIFYTREHITDTYGHILTHTREHIGTNSTVVV